MKGDRRLSILPDRRLVDEDLEPDPHLWSGETDAEGGPHGLDQVVDQPLVFWSRERRRRHR